MEMGAKVFLLQHVHTFEDGEEDIKTIGVYSTRDAAQRAIERLRSEPGFREAPDGFSVDLYTLDTDHWSEGYITATPRAEEEH